MAISTTIANTVQKLVVAALEAVIGVGGALDNAKTPAALEATSAPTSAPATTVAPTSAAATALLTIAKWLTAHAGEILAADSVAEGVAEVLSLANVPGASDAEEVLSLAPELLPEVGALLPMIAAAIPLLADMQGAFRAVPTGPNVLTGDAAGPNASSRGR
jgi:hypothetical protein